MPVRRTKGGGYKYGSKEKLIMVKEPRQELPSRDVLSRQVSIEEVRDDYT